MRNLLWRIVAWIVTRPAITRWLIERSFRTPFTHIFGRTDGSTLYMGRWWLFNPYPSKRPPGIRYWRDLLPSARIHRICRPDDDPHLHDHPWNARTIVLKGFYQEIRPQGEGRWTLGGAWLPDDGGLRERGYTGRLLFGQYHRITEVSEGGVWTLFITWRKRGTWGFMVDGHKVAHHNYLEGKN